MKAFMKKGLLAVLSLVLVLVMAGCGDVLGQLTGEGTASGAQLYIDLNSMMGSPDNLDDFYSEYIQKDITFTALILIDPEPIDFDEEDGGTQNYVSGTIARSTNDIFLLNVDGLETPPKAGDIVEITGKITGSVSYVEDNENIEVLDILASKVETKEPENSPSTENKIEIESPTSKGSFVFTKAQKTIDTFEDNVALLYFEYTNDLDKDSAPPIASISFYQGDTRLQNSIMDVEAELDPNALEARFNDAYAGKTTLYYMVLEPRYSDTELTDDPITAYYYDDDFNCKNQVEITLV